MFDVNTFKERLRLAREAKGLKQDEFAEILGISRSGYSYYETKTNDALPGLVLLDKMMEELGVSYDYLMGKDSLPTFNKEKISEITGLDENAINLLEAYNQTPENLKYVSVINALLASYPPELELLLKNIADYLDEVMDEDCQREDVVPEAETDLQLNQLNYMTSEVRKVLKDKLGMTVRVVPEYLYHSAIMEQIKGSIEMVVQHAYATYKQYQIEKFIRKPNEQLRSLAEMRDIMNKLVDAGIKSREQRRKE